MREPSRSRCPDCAHATDGPYCSQCGQRTDIDPQALRAWVGLLADEVLTWDGRLPRTLRALVRNPGLLTREWLAGRRRRWVHPLRLYLFASFILFAGSQLRSIGWVVPPADAATASSYAAWAEWVDTTTAASSQIGPIVLIGFVPILALLLRIFQGRRGDYFTDHVVGAMHLCSAGFLWLAATTVVAAQFTGTSGFIVLGVAVLGMTGYAVLSAVVVYSRSWVASVTRTVPVLVGYVLSVVASLPLVAGLIAPKPWEAVQALESEYSALVARPSQAGQDEIRELLTRLQRLEQYKVDASVRANMLDLLIRADSLDQAWSLANEGLVSAGDDPVLLAFAFRLAVARGADERIEELRRQLIDAYQRRGLPEYGVNHRQMVEEWVTVATQNRTAR